MQINVIVNACHEEITAITVFLLQQYLFHETWISKLNVLNDNMSSLKLFLDSKMHSKQIHSKQKHEPTHVDHYFSSFKIHLMRKYMYCCDD